MKEDHSYCVGCKKSFFLSEKNMGRTVGSPEYSTICHRRCCGQSDECRACSIYTERSRLMTQKALKSFMNIAVIAIQQMQDPLLNALQPVAQIDLDKLVGAELDKRAGIIKGYNWYVNDVNHIVLEVELLEGDI